MSSTSENENKTSEGKEEKSKGKIVLMGDSVLDNFAWLKDPRDNLTTQLRKLMPDYEIVNLAVDQMSTFDLEKRTLDDNPWSVYQRERREHFTTPETKNDVEYPVHEDGNIYSFENLSVLTNVKAVVLSIGGNDLYLNREIQSNMFSSLVPGKGHLLTKEAKEFGQRYQQILHKIRQIVASDTLIIPIIPYHPHYNFSLVFGAPSSSFSGKMKVFSWLAERMQYVCLSKLVSPLVKEILTAAVLEEKKNDLPPAPQAIDLSKTFDPFDEKDYGTGQVSKHRSRFGWSGAEPSNKSSLYIARLIAAICNKQFSFDPLKKSHVIHLNKKQDVIKAEEITSTFISNYSFARF